MQWQRRWAYRLQYGTSQEQMLSRSLGRGSQMIKMMPLEDSRSRRGRRRVRQLVDDDQMAETRGGEKGATVNIATDIATAAEAAAGKDTGSIGGEIETTRANRLHAVTAGLIGAEAAVGMRITADVTGTTEPREAEVAAGNIEGQREMDIVEDPQTDGGVLVLTAGGVKDEFQKPLEFQTLQMPIRATFGGALYLHGTM